jgi:chloramphenicol 3-O phosphotransferase
MPSAQASQAKIIFLHGASSSGKSSIARVLQASINEPFWHISIDHLRDSGVLPMARVRTGEFDWQSMRAPFFEGFHRSLAAYASAGNNLILEHILDTPGWLDELVALLMPFDVLFVGVHCSLEELQRREALRGDRQVGSAERDFNAIHNGLTYDLELDGEASVERNIEALLEAWTMRQRPTAFELLAAEAS